MVVIVDLEDEVQDPHVDPQSGGRLEHLKHQVRQSQVDNVKDVQPKLDDRPNPNVNSFSAILSCYPIVSQLASLLDLNSLHDLSRTCRQFRANLLEYRNQLITQSLRCSNDHVAPGPRDTQGTWEMKRAWTHGGVIASNSRLTSGKIGQCARDMVGECRRCGTVVCRNCTVKPPAPNALNGRHRRLCRPCQKAPLHLHLEDPPEDAETSSSTTTPAFTAPAFQREPCTCVNSIWICQTCGHALRTADTTYMRGWTWRKQYSTYLGGLGTGIGEGNEGVGCGRGPTCLAAREVEKEIDCDASELAELEREMANAEIEGRQWSGSSYLAHEFDGIGGTVKMKMKKRVKVGACVKEYEDEREHGGYLSREQKGLARSWCAWCERIIPSKRDLGGSVENGERPGSSDSSGDNTS